MTCIYIYVDVFDKHGIIKIQRQMVFKAAHLPTTPHTSATPVEPVFTALWFSPSFSSFSDSLTCQFYQVCCVVFCFLFFFHFLNKKLKGHLRPSLTEPWLSCPTDTLLSPILRILGCILEGSHVIIHPRSQSCKAPGLTSHLARHFRAPGGSRWDRVWLLFPGCLSLFVAASPPLFYCLWKVKHGLNPLWQVGNFCLYVTDSWINNIT